MQMLVMGRALMAHPKLLLLDEPSLGLAPLVVKEIFRIIRRINEEQGTTIVLVEQNANMALRIAHYGYVMENGRVVMEGDAGHLRDNPDVKEFYLGVGAGGATRSYRDIKSYKRRSVQWRVPRCQRHSKACGHAPAERRVFMRAYLTIWNHAL
jgi:branched-chain amino acid transport system ATP-binding protein